MILFDLLGSLLHISLLNRDSRNYSSHGHHDVSFSAVVSRIFKYFIVCIIVFFVCFMGLDFISQNGRWSLDKKILSTFFVMLSPILVIYIISKFITAVVNYVSEDTLPPKQKHVSGQKKLYSSQDILNGKHLRE